MVYIAPSRESTAVCGTITSTAKALSSNLLSPMLLDLLENTERLRALHTFWTSAQAEEAMLQ